MGDGSNKGTKMTALRKISLFLLTRLMWTLIALIAIQTLMAMGAIQALTYSVRTEDSTKTRRRCGQEKVCLLERTRNVLVTFSLQDFASAWWGQDGARMGPGLIHTWGHDSYIMSFISTGTQYPSSQTARLNLLPHKNICHPDPFLNIKTKLHLRCMIISYWSLRPPYRPSLQFRAIYLITFLLTVSWENCFRSQIWMLNIKLEDVNVQNRLLCHGQGGARWRSIRTITSKRTDANKQTLTHKVNFVNFLFSFSTVGCGGACVIVWTVKMNKLN